MLQEVVDLSINRIVHYFRRETRIKALKIFGFYSLFLVVFGTIGNTLIIIVCLKSKNNPTFSLIKYLAANDLISLFFWNLSHFTYSVFGTDLENSNIILCKLGNWIQFSSLQASAWILVFLSFERYFSFKIVNWKTKYFTSKIASKTGLFLTIFFLIINSNVLVLFGNEKYVNSTHIVECYTTVENGMYWMATWENVHAFLYSFIPFIVLACINFLLIKYLVKTLKNSQISGTHLNMNQLSISSTVIAITLMFILLTAPSAICSQFYYTLVKKDRGRVIIFASDNITFSYHALNVIFLSITNKEFCSKFKNIILRNEIKADSINMTTRRVIYNQTDENILTIQQ